MPPKWDPADLPPEYRYLAYPPFRPPRAPPPPPAPTPTRTRTPPFRALHLLLLLPILALFYILALLDSSPSQTHTLPHDAASILAQCASLHALPAPPANFHARLQSDRFVPGTPATVLRNATLWAGPHAPPLRGADILLDCGIIKALGVVPPSLLADSKLITVELDGAWVTPGIVDLHSHLGVYSAPALSGASDGNSLASPTQPWLRSLDGLNTHDDAYALSVSGGVTSALVLPGSADNIGGQAFMIKLRKTKERSASAMVLEPPWALWNGSRVDPGAPMRWRHMKHACGENPSRVYSGTRMDSIYRFRAIYGAAAALRDKQDAFCARAQAGQWTGLGTFPYDLQLEALVDTLRGRVKVNVHCYEAVDFDGVVRLTNEFRFPIAAFHHAHEAYLVPDLLKKTYGGAPAVAMFATNARYKRESYRGSEFAPKVLADEGIRVVMKSDHPVLDSRFLLYEAQQAHYYGLDSNLSLASVTSTPAEAAGFAHRIGSIKTGHDADLVIWDSHPLQLGATPKQVYIDGIAQLASPSNAFKPAELQLPPTPPDFDRESKEAVEYEGDAPLGPRKVVRDAVLLNVREVWQRDARGELVEYAHPAGTELATVVVRDGAIACVGASCLLPAASDEVAHVDLEGGTLAPGLVTFGSGLGLTEIRGEPSTNDGAPYDLLGAGVPRVLGEQDAVVRAADGLQFGGKDTLIAHRSGVTLGITPPSGTGFLAGLSTAFRTGAALKSEKGSVAQVVAALHVRVGHSVRALGGGGAGPSISGQVAVLRKLLRDAEEGSAWFQAARGELPLVVDVDKADIIATLLLLKEEVELQTGAYMRLVFSRANEAYLVAPNIAKAGAGVILSPSRPFPGVWDKRRTLPGPPLTEDTNLSVLLANNVTTAIGIVEEWQARNTRFDAAWAYTESYPYISKAQALALVSTNVEKLLGVKLGGDGRADMVAYRGGDMFSTSSKVVAVMSGEREMVELF